MKSITTVLLGAIMCTGCAPLPVTVASLLADGMSYATTEKSLTDHGLSALSEQDCAMHRLLTSGTICRQVDTRTVIAAGDRGAPTGMAPRNVATPKGNVAIADHPATDSAPTTPLESIDTPNPGIYMVVASSRDITKARTIRGLNPAMSPQIFAMPTGGRRVMYHVIVGPVTQDNYRSARKIAASHGFKNTWALKIDNSDWRRSRELEKRERLRLSAERVSVTRGYQPGS